MLTTAFVKALAERAIKTFAQTLAALLVADGTDLLNTMWGDRLSVAGMATLVSVLTSVASGATGGGPSLGGGEVIESEIPVAHAEPYVADPLEADSQDYPQTYGSKSEATGYDTEYVYDPKHDGKGN